MGRTYGDYLWNIQSLNLLKVLEQRVIHAHLCFTKITMIAAQTNLESEKNVWEWWLHVECCVGHGEWQANVSYSCRDCIDRAWWGTPSVTDSQGFDFGATRWLLVPFIETGQWGRGTVLKGKEQGFSLSGICIALGTSKWTSGETGCKFMSGAQKRILSWRYKYDRH